MVCPQGPIWGERTFVHVSPKKSQNQALLLGSGLGTDEAAALGSSIHGQKAFSGGSTFRTLCTPSVRGFVCVCGFCVFCLFDCLFSLDQDTLAKNKMLFKTYIGTHHKNTHRAVGAHGKHPSLKRTVTARGVYSEESGHTQGGVATDTGIHTQCPEPLFSAELLGC